MGTPAQEAGKLKTYQATVFLIEIKGYKVRAVQEHGFVRIDHYLNRKWKRANTCSTVLGAWIMVTQRITDHFRNSETTDAVVQQLKQLKQERGT